VAKQIILNMASRLQDFETISFTKGLDAAGYGILNGIFGAFRRTTPRVPRKKNLYK